MTSAPIDGFSAGDGHPGAEGRPDHEVRLPDVPALGALYRRAVPAAVRLAAARRAGRGAVTLPAVAYRVRGLRTDADRLTAYQHLVGESALDTLPAGFVHVLAFPVATALMVRDDFPLPLLGLVHLANEVQQRSALRVDDELEVVAWARALTPHRSGTQVQLVAQVRRTGDGDGPPAWQGVSTYLARGVRLVGAGDEPGERQAGDEPREREASDKKSGEREAFVAPEPTGAWHLAADTGRRYAAVSGDVNPIHLSAATARPFGFRRAIAHGMYTAARALADVGAARGEAYTWSAHFDSPVLLPSTVAVRHAVQRGNHAVTVWTPGRDRAHLRVEVVRGAAPAPAPEETP